MRNGYTYYFDVQFEPQSEQRMYTAAIKACPNKFQNALLKNPLHQTLPCMYISSEEFNKVQLH